VVHSTNLVDEKPAVAVDFPRNLGKNFLKSVGDARSTSSCSGGIL